MRKAFLFEALYKGIDEAVCGIHHLKKAPPLSLDMYVEGAAELELRRAKVNVQFMDDLREVEKAEVDRWNEKLNELTDEPLNLRHDAICRLMRIVEQQRREEGKPPFVDFRPGAPDLPAEESSAPKDPQPEPGD